MTIRHGTQPTKLNRKLPSYSRTFGIAKQDLPLMDYNFDAGLWCPNQENAESPYTDRPYSFGCTGFSKAEILTDRDGKIYKPGYIYEKTCAMEGHGADQGCEITTSLEALVVYGAQQVGETTEAQAQSHRSGRPFSVDRVPGLDWFDSFRLALRSKMTVREGISTGLPWMPEFQQVGADGVITEHFTYDGYPEHYGWHDSVFKGEKTHNGQPYLINKSHQGPGYGDRGFTYWSRTSFNKVFDNYGTIGLIPGEANPTDIKYIKLELMQWALVFLNRLLGLMGAQKIVVYA